MRTLSFIICITLLSYSSVSRSQELPLPSPLGKVEQRLGLTDITISYSRPSVKGRTIFGDLVPYDKLWRTGANKATKISFSSDVEINGNTLPAGTYAIFTIPSKEKWTVILNKNADQAGTGKYKEEEDAMRLEVKPQTSEMTESMTFSFDDLSAKSAMVSLRWEKTTVQFKVAINYEAMAQANIDEELKKIENTYSTYNRIARYYVDNNMKLDVALEMAQKSVAMKEKFWNVYTLSLAQAANKMYAEAIETAKKSRKLAEEAEYAPYIKRNDKNIKEWTAVQ